MKVLTYRQKFLIAVRGTLNTFPTMLFTVFPIISIAQLIFYGFSLDLIYIQLEQSLILATLVSLVLIVILGMHNLFRAKKGQGRDFIPLKLSFGDLVNWIFLKLTAHWDFQKTNGK